MEDQKKYCLNFLKHKVKQIKTPVISWGNDYTANAIIEFAELYYKKKIYDLFEEDHSAIDNLRIKYINGRKISFTVKDLKIIMKDIHNINLITFIPFD